MSGETKQMIANLRGEFRRLVLNQLLSSCEDDATGIIDGIAAFEEYLKSIDVDVEHQVPPLGVAITESAPVKDKFGG